MLRKIVFKSPFLFPVTNVALIGDFNNWSSDTQLLSNFDDNCWSTEIDSTFLSNGYKFLINDSLRMNDPTSNTYDFNEFGELVSFGDINNSSSSGDLSGCLNKKLEKFTFTEDFNLENPQIRENNDYLLGADQFVIVRLLIENVGGPGVVSCLWYGPDNFCSSVSENILISTNDGCLERSSLYFWMSLDDSSITTGCWTVQVLIDGALAYQDNFNITSNNVKFSLSDEIILLEENEMEVPSKTTVDLEEDSSSVVEILSQIEDVHIVENTSINPISEPEDSGEAFFDLLDISNEISDIKDESIKNQRVEPDNAVKVLPDFLETDLPVLAENIEMEKSTKISTKSELEEDLDIINFLNDIDEE